MKGMSNYELGPNWYLGNVKMSCSIRDSPKQECLVNVAPQSQSPKKVQRLGGLFMVLLAHRWLKFVV